MHAFIQILKIDMENLFTNIMWLFYCIAFPIALVFVLGFLTSGNYGDTVTSYDYYGVALMIYGIFNSTSIAANSFMEERIKSPNMRIIYSPVKPFYLHFSKVLASFVFCSVCYTIAGIILHLLFHINYGQQNLIFIYLLMLIGILFSAALGVMMCCLLKSESMTNQILSLLITLFSLLGGVFFQVDGLGKTVAFISWISPVKWLITSAMQVIYDNNIRTFLPLCGLFILLTIICVGISTKQFKGEEYL